MRLGTKLDSVLAARKIVRISLFYSMVHTAPTLHAFSVRLLLAVAAIFGHEVFTEDVGKHTCRVLPGSSETCL